MCVRFVCGIVGSFHILCILKVGVARQFSMRPRVSGGVACMELDVGIRLPQ